MISDYYPSHDTPKIPVCVDMFCGAGGLSYGLKQAGIESAAGIDIEKDCKYPYEHNVGAQFHHLDIMKVEPDFIRELYVGYDDATPRILAGCAPCQPFSLINKYRTDDTEDSRIDLLTHFGHIIKDILPDIVVSENVPGVIHYDVFKRFVRTIKDLGYHVWYGIVSCTDYGVPQNRRRIILLASRYGDITLIPPTHTKPVTVRDTIESMEPIKCGESSRTDPVHRVQNLREVALKRIRQSKPGGTWHDWDTSLRMPTMTKNPTNYLGHCGRMEWDKPAPTLTTKIRLLNCGRFGHPEQDRAISLREAAMLQTFPHGYQFVPESEPVRFESVSRLIGNAVPPRLGQVIGDSIMHHLRTHR